jgi:hypothetical protein
MANHNFKVGDTVYIVNRTMQGDFFLEGLEGKARIKRLLPNDNRYAVNFIASDGKLARQAHERFVDAAAQHEPQAFVNKLNGIE